MWNKLSRQIDLGNILVLDRKLIALGAKATNPQFRLEVDRAEGIEHGTACRPGAFHRLITDGRQIRPLLQRGIQTSYRYHLKEG